MRAALGHALAADAASPGGTGGDLVLRIGVNTGVVVTGSDAGRDFLVTGEAVNVAARLQQAAEPGEVLVGERTFRALQPLVRTVAPRSVMFKGRDGPASRPTRSSASRPRPCTGGAGRPARSSAGRASCR